MADETAGGGDALIVAVRAAAVGTVRVLLAAGHDPNRPDPASGLTPLMFAAGLGDEPTAAALIAAGALLDALDRKAGAAALHKACQGAHTGVLYTSPSPRDLSTYRMTYSA